MPIVYYSLALFFSNFLKPTSNSLKCYRKWPLDTRIYSTNLTYCQSIYLTYEREQAEEAEVVQMYKPNYCQTRNYSNKTCEVMRAHFRNRGASNAIFCCCRSSLCNDFHMQLEYRKLAIRWPICSDNRLAGGREINTIALFSSYCYEKLVFERHSVNFDLPHWKIVNIERGPDSVGSNPVRLGYSGCGSGIDFGQCALTRFYSTASNHLDMATYANEPAFVCCCDVNQCNRHSPTLDCWDFFKYYYAHTVEKLNATVSFEQCSSNRSFQVIPTVMPQTINRFETVRILQFNNGNALNSLLHNFLFLQTVQLCLLLLFISML